MVYPVLYQGPVNYFARLIREKVILLEQFDHYSKQTYRNRCHIVGPNGVLTLSIPVKRNRGAKTYMKDVRLDYDTSWHTAHWRTLVASYASSPFFEYFRDDLAPFYRRKFGFLLDLNLRLMELTLGWLEVSPSIRLSTHFTVPSAKPDPRDFIHPKKKEQIHDPGFNPYPYPQVFMDRMGFQPNMSILDLLFNEGNSAMTVLKRSLETSR